MCRLRDIPKACATGHLAKLADGLWRQQGGGHTRQTLVSPITGEVTGDRI